MGSSTQWNKLNQKAMTAIEELHKNKKKYVFLSNAPRPIENVKNFLLKHEYRKKNFYKIFLLQERQHFNL